MCVGADTKMTSTQDVCVKDCQHSHNPAAPLPSAAPPLSCHPHPSCHCYCCEHIAEALAGWMSGRRAAERAAAVVLDCCRCRGAITLAIALAVPLAVTIALAIAATLALADSAEWCHATWTPSPSRPCPFLPPSPLPVAVNKDHSRQHQQPPSPPPPSTAATVAHSL